MSSNPPVQVSIVIPAYNEAERLAVGLRAITNFLKVERYDWELIVVDDGSIDATRTIAESFAKEHSERVRVLASSVNQGKGAAVKRGVLAATKPIIIFTDADQATPIEELPKFVRALDHADVVIGSRYHAGSRVTRQQPWQRRAVSRIGNLVIRLGTGLSFSDTQCGFKAMTRSAAQTMFKRLTIERWGFDIELLVIAQLHQLRVVELPVTWHDGGQSKLQAGRAAVSTLRELRQIQRNVRRGTYA